MSTTPTAADTRTASGNRSARAPAGRSRVALPRRWRQATLVTHVVAAGAWIGIEVVAAILVLVGWFADDVDQRSLAYRSLAAFVVWPMLISGLVCLGSGLMLGLWTRWGLLRYWWVVVKLAANIALCCLIPVLLQPGMDDVANFGRELLIADPDRSAVKTLFFPPAVSLTTLVAATALAVVKPWGRTPWWQRRRQAAEEDRSTR